MLVLHVHVKGPSGHIERTYDFMRSDGKDSLEGMDVIIPFDKELRYPLNEVEVLALMKDQDMRGDH